MAEVGQVRRAFTQLVGLLGYLVSLYYGLWFLWRLLRRWVADPTDRFWVIKPRELPPDCLGDPALGTHAYVQIKNVKLHYVHKGDPTKPLMLCVHGFPEFWYSWRHQLQEFSSDYWVVMVDMTGYDDSKKPDGRDHYSIDHLVADLRHFITAVGREQCTLVAHDWGGIVAWYFVLQHPDMVSAYVIMNSVHPIAFYNTLNKASSQFRKSWYVFFFQLPYLPELMCRLDDFAFLVNAFTVGRSSPMAACDLEAYKFTFGKPGALTFPINYYRANFPLKGRGRLQSLGQSPDFPPGLVLFGDRDAFLDREVQEKSAQLVRNARVVYVSANHFVQQDNPAAVNRELRAFLSEIKSK